MIRLALLIWLAGSGLTLAAPVTVKSGEHTGFTRLVLDFGAAVDWSVGRTLDGYELRISKAKPTYNLTQVYDIIGKSRLAAIWADPATATLNVGIGCACHAIPFEFRPGIIVIDLRDGPPPKGSSFELAIDGSDPPVLAQKPLQRPRARPETGLPGYIWTDLALADLQSASAPVSQIAPSSDPAMEPLRSTLLRQLSRGAAQGMVDMVLPDKASSPRMSEASVPAVRLGLGALPGLSIGTDLSDHSDLGADGENCVPAASLDIANWGTDAPVFEQISASATHVVGEFDKPDPVALARAVKFQLFLGFGAESHQLLRAFPADLPDTAVWLSLGHIMDDSSDSAPEFRNQMACATPASLWSMLTNPAPMAGEIINKGAVLLAFSALPLPLRRHLGPRLADRFLALDDAETARTIRNAITRAPGRPGSDVDMMTAQIDLSLGDAAGAEAQLTKMLSDPGPGTPAALVALVVARVAQDLPIEGALVDAVAALLVEQSGSAQEPVTRHALTLAQAASGDFDAAFAGLSQSPSTAADVWRLLAKLGTDESVLAHAVLLPEQAVPEVPPDTASILVERLLNFGLAKPAIRWTGVSTDPTLQAQAYLAAGDARSALISITGVESTKALGLRAQALRLLGDDAEAQAFKDAGDTLGQRLALAQSRDWSQLAKLQTDNWGPVIGALADTTVSTEDAPLASGYQLADRSVKSRAVVAGLLASTALSAIKPR